MSFGVAPLKKYGSSAIKNSFAFACTLSYTGILSTIANPSSGLNTPHARRSSVLLPAPFVPISPKTSPSRTVTLTFFRASIPSKDLLTFFSSIMFSAHFCARFLRMSSLCQVRADTNPAIEKIYFSIFLSFRCMGFGLFLPCRSCILLFQKLGQLLNRHPHAQRFFFQIPELFQNFLLPDIL